jgi:hypothetical protein
MWKKHQISLGCLSLYFYKLVKLHGIQAEKKNAISVYILSHLQSYKGKGVALNLLWF